MLASASEACLAVKLAVSNMHWGCFEEREKHDAHCHAAPLDPLEGFSNTHPTHRKLETSYAYTLALFHARDSILTYCMLSRLLGR